MAILTQASSPVDDSGKISIALWARIPTATMVGGLGSIMAFGQRDNGPSFISVNSDGSISLRLYGVHNAYSYTKTPSAALGFSGIPETWGAGGSGPLVTKSLIVGTPAGVVLGDGWFWLGFSADVSGESKASAGVHAGVNVYTLDEAPNLYRLVVKGTDFTQEVTATGYTNPNVWPRGTILPGPGPDSWPANYVWPGWGVAINGFEFGIPCQSVDAAPDFNGPVELADIQVWVGQALDFSNAGVYSKFVKLSNGGANGTNVDWRVAAASFGPQTYLFTGGANRFFTNRGTGGPFTKVGTVNNFSGPGF